MPLSYKELGAPIVEPVSLTQAKQQCVVDTGNTDDDSLIQALITAARQFCEKKMQRAIFNRPMQLTMDYFPYPNFGSTIGAHRKFPFFSRYWDELAIKLPMPGCLAVSSISYIDQNGDPQTLDPSTYTVDINSEPTRIFPTSLLYWPWCQNFLPGNVKVLWNAGSFDVQVTESFNLQSSPPVLTYTPLQCPVTGIVSLLDSSGDPVTYAFANGVLAIPSGDTGQTLTLTYYAGTMLPQAISQAILLLVSYWYNHRDSAEVNPPKAIEQGVDCLLSGYVFDSFGWMDI